MDFTHVFRFTSLAAMLALAAGASAAAGGPSLADALSKARWQVRDVAADSNYAFGDAAQTNLKLELQPNTDTSGKVWKSSCTVTSTTPADRAVTLSLIIPLDLRGGTWWDDPQRTRPADGDKPFLNQVDLGFGATFMCSRYPLAVVAKGGSALCIAVPVEPQRIVRFLYDPAKRELRAEFDFGLSPIPQNFPSRADATVIAYEVPAKWAFRQALARYHELHPDVFKRRAKRAGVWLPFQSVTSIERPQDFGITCHEIPMERPEFAAEDEPLGIDAYPYIEPQTFWREFKGDDEKRDYPKWVTQLWEDAVKGDAKSRATITSGIELADGRRDLYLGPVAYTPAAPFGVNPDPEISTEDWGGWPNKGQYEIELFEKTLAANKTIDGAYIDSMEGWGQIGDYSRAHWRTTRYPLTFHTETKRPCLFNHWGMVTFAKTLAESLRARGMTLMGNDVYFRFWFLAPYIDIAGREYRWVEDGKWTPVSDSQYLLIRSMSAKRPYLMLMNNEFDDGSRMEEYFQRSLFYAVYPSMFSGHAKIGDPAYFSNSKWYDRDRHLFLKYIPMVRKLDEAGWEPVPYADAAPESVRIERYGSSRRNNLAFTLHNPTDKPVTAEITLSERDLSLPAQPRATEWISGKAVAVENGRFKVELPANGYAAVGIER